MFLFVGTLSVSSLTIRIGGHRRELSRDSYEYPGEIVILKGFEEATTDEDNNEEGDEFKSNELIEVHNS